MNFPFALALTAIALVSIPGAIRAQDEIPTAPPGVTDTSVQLNADVRTMATYDDMLFTTWDTVYDARAWTWDCPIVIRLHSDTSSLRHPGRVFPAAARPFGFTYITNVNGYFIVVWNDRRSTAPGIYLRRFDKEGHPWSVEKRIAEGAVTPSPRLMITTFGKAWHGRLLVWNTKHGAYGYRLSSVPDMDQDWGFISAGIRQCGRAEHGASALVRLADSTIHFVDAAGHLTNQTVPSERFGYAIVMEDNIYTVDDMLSLVCIDDDTVRFYRSVFDSMPARVLHIVRNAELPTLLVQESSGRGELGGRYRLLTWDFHVDGAIATLRTYRTLFDTSGVLRRDTLNTDSLHATPKPAGGFSTIEFDGFSRIRDIRNFYSKSEYLLIATIRNRWGHDSSDAKSGAWYWQSVITSEGELSRTDRTVSPCEWW